MDGHAPGSDPIDTRYNSVAAARAAMMTAAAKWGDVAGKEDALERSGDAHACLAIGDVTDERVPVVRARSALRTPLAESASSAAADPVRARGPGPAEDNVDVVSSSLQRRVGALQLIN